MYVPAENVYYEIVVKSDDGAEEEAVAEYAMGRRVIPVSPNSFYAYLRVIVLGLKGLRIERDAQEIQARLGRLRGDLDRFRETLQRLGYPDNPLADRLADVYGTVRLSSLALYPDATVVLEDLRLKKALGLVTNGPAAVQRGQIQALDLDRYFRHILVSEEVGYSKPHPEIFRRALELAEVTREEALFVGDTPETDIAGAQQVGMQTVWLNRRGRRWPANLPEPDHSIASLQELLRLV